MTYLRLMQGLGDTIYAEPIVRWYAEQGPVTVETCWPQLFAHLPDVRCVLAKTALRTQAKNVAAMREKLPVAPVMANPFVKTIRYKPEEIARGVPMSESLRKSAGVPDDVSMMPFLAIKSARGDVFPYVVVRPVTVRSEWRNEARNPLPEYVASCAKWAAEAGYRVISVADIDGRIERAIPPLPIADETHHAGMPITELMALVAGASAVIGGIGWIVPASIALGVPLFAIVGGQLGHNAPSVICPPDWRHKVTFAMPARPCYHCIDMRHNCDRTIPDLVLQWAAFQSAHLPRTDLARSRRDRPRAICGA